MELISDAIKESKSEITKLEYLIQKQIKLIKLT